MRNSIRIISNILGYFINIFLIAVIMAYFFNSWDLQFNILFHYFNNYKQSIFTIMIILSYLYLYSLRLISTNNSKELVNFIVSVLMSVVSVLIFNKLLYQNTYNNIPICLGAFCIYTLILSSLEDSSFSLEMVVDTAKLTLFLFVASVIFSRVYYCFYYIEDYTNYFLMFFDLSEILTLNYFEYFMRVFIAIYALLLLSTSLLFILSNLITFIKCRDRLLEKNFNYIKYIKFFLEDDEENIDSKTEEG